MRLVSLLLLPILFILTVMIVPSLALKPDVSINIGEGAEVLGKSVEYGKKIEFRVRICVKSTSPVPLDGFHIVISFRKPDGKWLFAEKTVNDYIPIGKCKDYNFRLDYVADQIGTWKYIVSLYTKDKEHKLDEEEGTFEVYGLPEAEVDVLEIVSWAVAASMAITGVALIASRIL